MVECQDRCCVRIQCCGHACLEVPCCDGAHACKECAQVHIVQCTLNLAQQCTLLQQLHGQCCMACRELGNTSKTTTHLAGHDRIRGCAHQMCCANLVHTPLGLMLLGAACARGSKTATLMAVVLCQAVPAIT